MRASYLRNLVMPFLLTALCGCGFQLQGRQNLSPTLARLHMQAADAQSDFTRALRASLKASGASLLADGESPDTLLRISRDEVTERVLSVDARNIPTDYELTYEVEITVRSGEKELLPLETLQVSRIYSFDERRQLAKEREKEILRDALARDLAHVVTRRLSTLQ